MSRIERQYCLTFALYLLGLFDIFILLDILLNCVCLGSFLPIRTPCGAHHKGFESHKRSILDISANLS